MTRSAILISLIAALVVTPAAAHGQVTSLSVSRVTVAADGVPIGVVRVVQRGETAAPNRLTVTIGEWGGDVVGRHVEVGCARRAPCRRTIPVAGLQTRSGATVRLKPLTLYLVTADAGGLGAPAFARTPLMAAFVTI